MRRFKRIISMLCLILLLVPLGGCKSNTPEQIQKEFNTFLDDVFINEVCSDSLSLHYLIAHPENYGIKRFKARLGEYSIEQIKRDLVSAENMINEMKNFDYQVLSKDSQITYDILMDTLNKKLKKDSYLYFSESLGPTTGLQAQLPILLAEYAFYTKEDIDTYIELLGCVDEYFESICNYEREKSAHGYFMTDEVADSIIAQCSDFIADPEANFLIEYFNEKLQNFEGLTAKEILLYEENNRSAVLNSVIPAYESIIDTLSELKGSCKNSNGLCGFEHGKDYYELKVQSSTGSSKTVPEMKAALKSALNQSLAALTTLSIQNPQLYNQYQAMKFPAEDPNEIMNYLVCAISADFPSIESVTYHVKYVHKSLSDHLSPAMYLVPPIDDYTTNNIYINNTPAYDMTKLFPTVAHEGYPGHLYQNVYFRQLDYHPIRSLLDFTGYDEGWATYVECYSYDLAGLNQELADFLQANMIAVHCLYSLTDIGIHYDGWTKEQTVNFWLNYVYSEEDAEMIYYAILAEPGIYLPYSIGYLEIIELRNLAKKTLQDDFNIKDFHQFLLDYGPAPFKMIQNAMYDWLKIE